MTPLFSVVIPCHNCSHLVTSTLETAAAQELGNFEIITIDDGSTDDTFDSLMAWKESHPRIAMTVIRQTNRYQGAARNRGIKAARGEYIAFLDADDLWLPTKLQRCSEFLRTNHDVDVVCHDQWQIHAGRRSGTWVGGPWATYRDLLLHGNCLSPSATVVRRSSLLSIEGFNEDKSYFGVEDYDCWLRLAAAGNRFSYLHEVLGSDVFHDSSMTVTHDVVYRENTVHLFRDHFSDWQPSTARERRDRQRILAWAELHLAHALARNGDQRAAWVAWLGAAERSPSYSRVWIWPALMIATSLGWRYR